MEDTIFSAPARRYRAGGSSEGQRAIGAGDRGTSERDRKGERVRGALVATGAVRVAP